MTTPDFSEFTYGFSLVHSFLGDRRWGIRSIPIFPNQLQEGDIIGGYDVALNMRGIVALFQFKIPQVMERRPKNDLLGGFSAPYYRMHMHFSKKHGNKQHNSLLNHERRGQMVRYCTPAFHELWVMKFLSSKRRIHDYSVFLKPSSIGKLSSGRHYVAYSMMSMLPHSPTMPPPRRVLLRSSPILIDGEFGTCSANA